MKSLTAQPTDDPAPLRIALNLSGNGIMLFRCLRTAAGSIQEFRLMLANRKAEEMTGLDEQAMLGQTPEDLFPHTVSTEIWNHARHVVDSGESFETTISYRAVDQAHEGWFSLTLQPYGDGVAASLTDVTALRQQSLLIDTVLTGSINGMIAFEAMRREPTGAGPGELYDLQVRLANEAAAQILSTPLSQLTTSTLLGLYPSIHASGLFAQYAHTIETGEPHRIESHYTFDGLNNWFDILISKLGDGMLMTLVDTTSAKTSQQELQRNIDDLQRSNQNLERFAYVASHDLQEPLRKIQSFGEMLSHQPEGVLSAYSTGLIGRMQSAANRMNTLIHDLLSFSRLSSQKQPSQRVDL